MMNSHNTAPATGVPPASPAFFRRGFTLIEVLVAVIIIGLGMIGLSALFAGAARQQQLVSQSSRGTTAARNTESKIIETFSGFRDGADLAKCVAGYAGNIANVPAADKLGVEWVPVNSNLENALSIYNFPSSNGDNTDNCVWAYFEKPIQGFTMYDARGLASLSSVLGRDGFLNAASAVTTFAGFNPYFPVRSVVADTLEIDVYIGWDGVTTDDGFTTPGEVKRLTFAFDPRDAAAPTFGSGPCNSSTFLLRQKDDIENFLDQGWQAENWRTENFIRINAFKCPSSGETKLELSPANSQFAEIDAMKIFGVTEPVGPAPIGIPEPPRTGRYIQRVEVRSCTHRETTLLSMSDRIVSEVGADGATRDVAGISVMMRGDGTDSGNMLVAVFSYALQANREGARFIPADRAGDPNLTRPIRSARVSLVYNTDTESYWFYCSRANPTLEVDESFLARQGQTVLFAGNALAGLPGADGVSKVTRVVQLSRGRGYWCELERAPRAGAGIAGLAANAVVPVINFPFAPSSAAGAAGNFVVYAVNNLASTRLPPVSGGGTSSDVIEATPQWQLRPIEARVFTISR